jgi:hypothetical protein
MRRYRAKLQSLPLLFVAAMSCEAALGAILFESATLGPTTNSVLFQPSLNAQHLGVQFSLPETAHIQQIGGHFIGRGTVFGAIVPLELDGFPIDPNGKAWPNLKSVALATAVFELPKDESAEVLRPVNIVLQKGTYGLVFGANLFDRRSMEGGAMVDSGQDIGNPEYFFWESSDNLWRDLNGFPGKRFVIHGVNVPEPSTNLIVAAVLSPLLLPFRKR